MGDKTEGKGQTTDSRRRLNTAYWPAVRANAEAQRLGGILEEAAVVDHDRSATEEVSPAGTGVRGIVLAGSRFFISLR